MVSNIKLSDEIPFSSPFPHFVAYIFHAPSPHPHTPTHNCYASMSHACAKLLSFTPPPGPVPSSVGAYDYDDDDVGTAAAAAAVVATDRFTSPALCFAAAAAVVVGICILALNKTEDDIRLNVFFGPEWNIINHRTLSHPPNIKRFLGERGLGGLGGSSRWRFCDGRILIS